MRHTHNPKERQALIGRLHRIQGQLNAVEKMVEADIDCSKVLMQVVAARRALKSFGDKLVQSHMHDCIEHADSLAESRKNLSNFITVLERYTS